MAGVDELIKRGYIDAKRLGVTGGSGGGLLTNWIVTQTTRFAAACRQRDIADWSGFWYTADFTLFTPTLVPQGAVRGPGRLRGALADHLRREDQDAADAHRWAKRTTARRRPPAARMMFRALKYLKQPTVMVRFPGETHELSRSGKPWHRVERLQHIVGWFDKWLLGKENATYEPPAARPAPAAATTRDPGPPTRADILRGEYGRYRANNDLLSYHLDVRVDPDKKFISGKNTIRFKMLKDDTRIQLDLVREPERRQDPARHDAAQVRARAEHRLRRLSRDAQDRAATYAIDFYYSGTPHADRPLRRLHVPQGSGRAGPGSTPPAKARARASGGRTRISGATKSRAWRSASPSPTTSSTSRTAGSSGKTDLGDGYTRWDWHVHYPINNYDVSLNIGNYEHFADHARRPDARLLRAAGGPRQGEGAVRAGQGDDRGLSSTTSASIRSRRTATS